jgi:hypothetical protein
MFWGYDGIPAGMLRHFVITSPNNVAPMQGADTFLLLLLLMYHSWRSENKKHKY